MCAFGAPNVSFPPGTVTREKLLLPLVDGWNLKPTPHFKSSVSVRSSGFDSFCETIQTEMIPHEARVCTLLAFTAQLHDGKKRRYRGIAVVLAPTHLFMNTLGLFCKEALAGDKDQER